MEYVGREFKLGSQDCYTLFRDYYSNEFGIELTNYARPDDFWEHDFDLYMPRYRREGFELIHDTPRHGDAVLMAVNATYANHVGVILPDGQLLHHMLGRLSLIEPYRALWRNMTVAVVRHPDVPAPDEKMALVDIREVVDGLPV